MPIVFSAAADFTGIRESGGLMITDVLHKAFVAINVAAAVTAVVVGETSIPETATLAMDRPFIILIRDRPSGTILFLGRYHGCNGMGSRVQ